MHMTTFDLRLKVGHSDLYISLILCFIIHQEMSLARGICAPLGTCSSCVYGTYCCSKIFASCFVVLCANIAESKFSTASYFSIVSSIKFEK